MSEVCKSHGKSRCSECDYISQLEAENAKLKAEYDDKIKAMQMEIEYQRKSATGFCKQVQEKNDVIDKLKAELVKERECVDYYAGDVWDICEDEVSGQQRSCIDNSDDDGGEIFGGKRAIQRQKERDQSILKDKSNE